MLVERIENPWIRFKVLFATLNEGDKKQLAKEAFLHVIANYNALSCDKKGMLDEIVKACPIVTKTIFGGTMYEHFQDGCEKAREKKHVVSTTELEWVRHYIKGSATCLQAERLIYRSLLCASDFWNTVRYRFNWTISEDDRKCLALEVLVDKTVGAKRKMEIAKEFGESPDSYTLMYFRKLLLDGHCDKAKTLKVNRSDFVIGVIVLKLDNGDFQDALDIAENFLPERKDIIKEIKGIAIAFEGK